jgi:hypothetical protein
VLLPAWLLPVGVTQVCENKCRPMCTKVPVMVEVQPVVVQPVMMSKGKGKGFGH